jgi:DNA-directed RNA polymerase subunit K/omega
MSDEISKDDVNKYEQVLIAAREARRLNELAKLNDRELKRRPTQLAWERLEQDLIKFTYERETLDPNEIVIEPVEPPVPPVAGE